MTPLAPAARAARLTAILTVGLVMAAPLFIMVSGSLKTASEIAAFPPVWLPADPQWGNYAEAWAYLTPQVIVNSFVFALGVLVVQLSIALPAGFALAHLRFRGASAVLGTLVMPMFVPANLTLIPLFVITYQLGWLNTFAGLIIPVAAQCAFGVLLFRQFFGTLPPGLFEAARLDGAGWFRSFALIGLPLVKPALATYCSITFLTAWNMFIWPQIVAPNPANRVINVALAPLASGANTLVSPAVALAGAVIAITPVLIVFLVSQRWYIKGVAGTGLE